MNNVLGAAEVAVTYAYQAVLLKRPLGQLTVEAGQDPTTQAYLNDYYTSLSVAAMSIGAAARYDMEYPKGSSGYDAHTRYVAMVNAGL
jgi:hypothetical protein